MRLSSRPAPELGPAPITLEQYHALAPEKIELLDGYLFYGPDDHKTRQDALLLLLTNERLEAVVRLAPVELWREALRRVYGQP